MRHAAVVLALSTAVVCTPARADTARDILVNAAFTARDKNTALARVNQAIAVAETALKRNPRDLDSQLQHALAISYRGKLNRNRGDVVAARREMEAVVAANPRDPDAQMALGAWHYAAIIELGPMIARTVLGARSAAGNDAMGKALALDRDRAAVPALASLQRIQLDPSDVAGARQLAEAALRSGASTTFDKLMQRQAAALLNILRTGNGKVAAETAKLLMPFGRVVG